MCRQGRHHITSKQKRKESFTSCSPSIGVRNLVMSSYLQKNRVTHLLAKFEQVNCQETAKLPSTPLVGWILLQK